MASESPGTTGSTGAGDPLRALVAAVRKGDRGAVRAQLASHPELVNRTDPMCFDANLITHAAQRGDREMVDELLAAGFDIDAKSGWWAGGFAPIHNCLDRAREDMAAFLVSRGATVDAHAAAGLGDVARLRALLDEDPARAHERGGDGGTPLHFARTPEVAALLLERGAEIDARDLDHESTAAQWAVTSRPEVARFLVERGAAADAFLLAGAGLAQRLRELLARDPAQADARITETAFPRTGARAAKHMYFFTIGGGCAPLHAAAGAGQAEAAEVLLEAGANPNARGGYDDQTPLHAAAWHGHDAVTEVLLDAGAEIDAPSGRLHHNSPLGWAIVAGRAAVVRLLITHGAHLTNEHRLDAIAAVKGEFSEISPATPRDRSDVMNVLAAALGNDTPLPSYDD